MAPFWSHPEQSRRPPLLVAFTTLAHWPFSSLTSGLYTRTCVHRRGGAGDGGGVHTEQTGTRYVVTCGVTQFYTDARDDRSNTVSSCRRAEGAQTTNEFGHKKQTNVHYHIGRTVLPTGSLNRSQTFLPMFLAHVCACLHEGEERVRQLEGYA